MLRKALSWCLHNISRFPAKKLWKKKGRQRPQSASVCTVPINLSNAGSCFLKATAKRRKRGIDSFWSEEVIRLTNGEKGTRNWNADQRAQILAGRKPKFNGMTMQSHHTYSVLKYPHLANRGEIIYPVTILEHQKDWHGGSTHKSLPGQRIRPIQEF
ncbi:MAG: hypothetical protein ACI37P_00590 [Eggerthellaceae bacterium]